jgi:Endonuclease/Exonuclease/phosphatase family
MGNNSCMPLESDVRGGQSSSTTLRFASWNVGTSATRLKRQIDFLRGLDCDVVALQEVSAENGSTLEGSGMFSRVWQGLVLRPRGLEETAARNRGCVLLATDRFRPVGEPEILLGAAAPERSIAVRLAFDGGELSAASFHQVAGSDKKKWGPAKKRQTFRAIADWLGRHPTRAIVGIDANSPELDHPDVERNVYFFDRLAGDQDEHLLHDPLRATHVLVDVYRVYLRDHPDEVEANMEARPEGPVAVSHYNRGRPRRFDFIYATPDLRPESVVYHGETLTEKLSDHALVVADLAVSP